MCARTARNYRGVIIIQMVIALVALLGAAALALDMGHAYLNKTRLQNAVDAAALGGAKVLDITADTTQASTEVRSVMQANALAVGNEELGDAWTKKEITLTIQYSEKLSPFVPGANGPYVRVIAEGLTLESFFARVVGINELHVAARAVAGPSAPLGNVCDISPLVICGTNSPPYYGYSPGQVLTLKASPKNPSESEVGPGNFQLIRLEGDEGGGDVRNALAGNFERCMGDEDSVRTEPGVKMGPVVAGIGTLFGPCSTPLDCYDPDILPDKVTYYSTTPGAEFRYADYESRYRNGGPWNYPDGVPDRRILTVVIGDCSQTVNGTSDRVPVFGFGCFFLIAPVSAHAPDLRGEFIKECEARGVPGPGGGTGFDLHRIVLHNDPDSDDS